MGHMILTVPQPGHLHQLDFNGAPAERTGLIVKGKLNDNDMSVLRRYIQSDEFREYLETVDLSDVTGISRIPEQMFSRCRRLKEVLLPAVPIVLGSQAFAYSPELSLVGTEQITGIEAFDCFAFCEHLPGMNFAAAETAGSFSFRKTVFKGSALFSRLKTLSSYIFQDAVIGGDLVLPEVTCCAEDAFFGAAVLGKIDLPNCTEMKYGVFNELRMLQSLRLTSEQEIALNYRTFSEHSCMKNTVLYLHPNKKNSVRDRYWGGVLWKEILFEES